MPLKKESNSEGMSASSHLRQWWDQLHSPKLQADPDARLAFYKNFFATTNSSLTGDSKLSINSGPWIHIALRGVGDVWSVIRKHSVAQLVATLRKVCSDDRESGCRVLRFMTLTSMMKPSSNSIPRETIVPWFRCDGFLQLIRELLKGGEQRLSDRLFSEAEQTSIHLNYVIPMAFHDQLAVRTLAVTIVKEHFVESFTSRSLLQSVLPATVRRFLFALSDSSDAQVEGSISLVLAVPPLHDWFVGQGESLVNGLAGHNAATVRQLCADVLSLPRKNGIQDTLGMLTKALASADEKSSWKKAETLLMALHAQLMGYCQQVDKMDLKESPDIASPTTPTQTKGINILNFLTTLLNATKSDQFEVRRMATQTVPLFCQYVVRRHNSGVVFDVVNNFHGESEVTKLVAWFTAVKYFVAQRQGRSDVAADIEQTVRAFTVTHTIDPCAKIILRTYFEKHLPNELEAWHLALESESRAFACRFAMDYAATSVAPTQIAALWVNIFRHSESHTQLQLIEALRVALLPEGASRSLFAFAHRQDMKAPCLVDGGDDVPEAFHWLHCKGSETRYPITIRRKAMLPHHEHHLDPNSSTIERNHDDSTALFHVVQGVLFHDILINDSLELKVVTAIFSLLLDFYRLKECDARFAIDCAIRRLDSRYPRWECSSEPECNPQSVKLTTNSFDDSDTDESDEESVAGINRKVEIEKIREHLLYGLFPRAPSREVCNELAHVNLTESQITALLCNQ